MTIKEQIENEINRRVREALDTPPLERIKRHQQEAILRKSQQQEFQKQNLNAHLKLFRKEKSKFCAKPSISTNLIEKPERNIDFSTNETINEEIVTSGYNKFEYWLKPHYQPHQITSSGIMFKLNDNSDGVSQESQLFRTGFEALQNFGNLTMREKEVFFSTFTKDGFKEAIRTGRLPDGSKLEALANGVFRDKYGIMRDKDGPFWPKNIGPLYPAPHHKRIHSVEEPLYDSIKERFNSQNFKIQNQYTAIWRHMQIVYDSEMSTRNQRPVKHADNVCPTLIFESRFESGNLRQARRIGQFEYELVLNNDLYTKRHTQWFYFSVQNMKKDITYKFIIINLLKPTSLYMEGMRMLMYSEHSANRNKIGWHRTGHLIRYLRNFTHLQCPLLDREIAYFQLEFQIEFPHNDDVCYLSHCYPYTFTDLKNDLNKYQQNNDTSDVFEKDVLCETKIGNSCFMVTITDKNVPDNEKLAAIITARVHPGETNSSWMMNGLIQYLISDCSTAKHLRKAILFKIIPMLNPDGVIVGNYRCSTAGRDLNRNYRYPKEESFPTIYHTKKLVESLRDKCSDILLYCDLHGHSRKHNVFMYGCDSQYVNAEDVNDINPILNLNTIQAFIKDRIFPFLMQKNGPDMFTFTGCQFKIRKCKESTGRVVMWKQYNIADSYTLETTFSGSDLINRKHFNVMDLENIGKIFSESLSSYICLMKDEKMKKEIGLELLKTILKQLVRKNKQINNLFRRLASQTNENNEKSKYEVESSEFSRNIISDIKSPEMNINLESFIDQLEFSDLNQFNQMNFEVSEIEENSSSSDSDSESQPEEIVEIESKSPMKVKRKKKKLKAQNKETTDISSKKPQIKRSNSKNLPLINKMENSMSNPENKFMEKTINTKFISKNSSLRQLPIFLSKYEGRSNGGIPCYTEERVLERARRKSLITIKRDLEESLFNIPTINEQSLTISNTESQLAMFLKSAENISEQYRKLQKQSNDILHYRFSQSSGDKAVECSNERVIQKPVLSMNQIKEISKNQLKQQHIVLKSENGYLFKSITSDVPLTTAKESSTSKKVVL